MQVAGSWTGGQIESIQVAANQTEEAENEETPCDISQAREEADAAKREDEERGRPQKRCSVAGLQGDPAKPARLPVSDSRRTRPELESAAGPVNCARGWPGRENRGPA